MKTNIDFVGRRNIWFILSGIVIAIGIAGLIIKGLTFGIEFQGGTLFDVKYKNTITVADVRNSLKPLNLEDSVIQSVGNNNKEILIRTGQLSAGDQKKAQSVLRVAGATDFSIQTVGPTWGRQLTRGTLVALLLSLTVVLGFISLRFELKMGTAAVIALAHDVLIAIGLYSLIGREVTTSTIAAFLTILGYSMYDTIVVFDRIRENAAGLKKQTYIEMVNTSINQVLRRSINTSITSVIPVATLFFIGGETLRDFAFALMVGLISGAYSSIFIASPILAIWKDNEPKYRALRKKLSKAS